MVRRLKKINEEAESSWSDKLSWTKHSGAMLSKAEKIMLSCFLNMNCGDKNGLKLSEDKNQIGYPQITVDYVRYTSNQNKYIEPTNLKICKRWAAASTCILINIILRSQTFLSSVVVLALHSMYGRGHLLGEMAMGSLTVTFAVMFYLLLYKYNYS